MEFALSNKLNVTGFNVLSVRDLEKPPLSNTSRKISETEFIHVYKEDIFVECLSFMADQEEVILHIFQDPFAIHLKSPSYVNSSTFDHCKYEYKLHGKSPFILLLQLLFMFFSNICRERVCNLSNEMFSLLHWKYNIT